MESIPEEIWLQIFKFFQNARPIGECNDKFDVKHIGYDQATAAAVRPLTETCHAFHRMCQPLLFETIVIDGSSEASQRRARCLADVLHGKPHLKNMVFRVNIFWTISMEREPRERMERVVAELSSVRDMWIRAAIISTRLLGQRPRLERLVLIEAFASPTEGPAIHSFDSLKYLRYKPSASRDSTYSFMAFVVPQLQTLQIDSAYLTSPRGYQVFQFNPAILKELTISISFTWSHMEEGLVELLKRASQIKSLKLPLYGFSPGFRLADDLIPELETFEGLADLVLPFCKGRPIRDLHASFALESAWSMMDNVPNLIRPGSVPLEHLHLDWTLWEDDTMEYIARYCPQLISLTIGARGGCRNVKLPTRYPMPMLRRAAFRSLPESRPWCQDDDGGYMAEKEAKLVQESREFWPQLESLRLHPKHFWTYRDLEDGWVQVKDVE